MAAKTCKAQDGSTITDGEKATLELAYDTEKVTVTGVIRFFEQVDRVYDEEGVAVGRNKTTHWEILTDSDPLSTAIGFLPKNVLTKV